MLTTVEIEKLKAAYRSNFYARVIEARRDVSDALEELDAAIANLPHDPEDEFNREFPFTALPTAA